MVRVVCQGVLNNCTVVNNSSTLSSHGSGLNQSIARNSIVQGNYDASVFGVGPGTLDNYDQFSSQSHLTYCLSSPLPPGVGNIIGAAPFVDFVHIPSDSFCRGAGSSLYTTGTDIDGEPWATPPSIGCDEVIESTLTGPLSVAFQAFSTNTSASSFFGRLFFTALITGKVTHLDWSFGDGPKATNLSYFASHVWANAGDYTLIFTVYNTDHPDGVVASLPIHVAALIQPLLQPPAMVTNGFQLRFSSQAFAFYTVQYAPTLVPPVAWQTLKSVSGAGGTLSVTDTSVTNASRFYRVLAQ